MPFFGEGAPWLSRAELSAFASLAHLTSFKFGLFYTAKSDRYFIEMPSGPPSPRSRNRPEKSI